MKEREPARRQQMSNDNVVGIKDGPQRKVLVDSLKELTIKVESGDISSFIGVAAKPDGGVFTVRGGVIESLEVLTSINAFFDIIKLELLLKLDDALVVHKDMDEVVAPEEEEKETNTSDVSVDNVVRIDT